MALREIKTTFGDLIRLWTQVLIGEKHKRFKYAKHVGISIGAVLALIGAFLAYRWYVQYREQAAQKAWAEQLVEYHRAVQSGLPQDWEHVAMQFKFAHERHSSANTAPYLLAFQAQAVAKQGKLTDAIDVQSQLLDDVSRKSPMYPLFKMQRALMMLDTDDETMQQKGLQELIEVAQDKHNKFNDMALYYLGRYYWAKDDVGEAQKIWQELVDSHREEQIAPSPWVKAAEHVLRSSIK